MLSSEPHPSREFHTNLNQDTTEWMCLSNPSISSEHVCDSKFMEDLVSVVHSRPIYDQAQGIYSWKQSIAKNFNDPLG